MGFQHTIRHRLDHFIKTTHRVCLICGVAYLQSLFNRYDMETHVELIITNVHEWLMVSLVVVRYSLTGYCRCHRKIFQ